MSGSRGMSVRTARTIEYAIVLLSVVALAMIFQPFSLRLFSVGAGMVVLMGLAFNLVPLAQPGRRLAGLLKGSAAIVLIFVIVTGLALAVAWAYGVLFTGQP